MQDGASPHAPNELQTLNERATPIISLEHFTLTELAEWLRCSTRTVQRLIETGEGPPMIKLSDRRVIFRKADAQQWLARRTSANASVAKRKNAAQHSDQSGNAAHAHRRARA
jgi:predicted DNA-binding transcriptional regulator AlpA